jgi:ankyrin repeat/BTB/POZ domain-containing protein 1
MVSLSLFFSQAFFCGRSEYFNALLQDHFSETTAVDGNPMVTIRNVPVEAFAAVVYYIYTNVVQVGFSAVEYSFLIQKQHK